uniref:Uncharacterized protein n=1 Tax=Picea glauca TaxID=3330 RepID=A0A124GND2_PICGL|nr:hypothetical protein ABT39_MTgene4453 [Picea glauca]QHR91347.1 hypothetical protein Q903MT_gene5379 [Picea sitchensis]
MDRQHLSMPGTRSIHSKLENRSEKDTSKPKREGLFMMNGRPGVRIMLPQCRIYWSPTSPTPLLQSQGGKIILIDPWAYITEALI